MSDEFSVRSCDLSKLNSMTKYPSIPTYHTLGEKGALLEETVPFEGEIVLTEKVDGTNSRIILLPDGTFILGSREELLFAKGDLIGNPALGIVEALKAVASTLPQPIEPLLSCIWNCMAARLRLPANSTRLSKTLAGVYLMWQF